MGGGATAPGVVVVQELRLVRGHVDLDRAVGAAALAGQAQVQGVPDLRRPPAVRHQLAREHLVQQTGPPPRGVLLLPRRPEGRAHHTRARHRRRTALGDPDAAAHRRREVAAVGRVAERHVHRLPRQDGEAEVRVEGCRADQHAGVEEVVRVPDGLRAFEEGDGLRAVHPRQQLGPRLPVAVLPGQRAAVRHDQVRQLLREAAEAGHPGVRQQVEVDAYVDAAVPEVPVRDAAQAMGGQEAPEVPQVGAQPGRRHRAVLPAGPRLRTSPRLRLGGAPRHPRRRPARVLPDPPQRPLPGRVGDHQRVHDVGRAHDRLRTRAGLSPRLAARLHEQPRPAPGQQGRGRHRHQVHRHPLHRQRPERQQPGRRFRRARLVGVSQHRQRTRAGRLDQPYDRLGQHAQRALRAAEGAGHVRAPFREQGVQRVTGDTAREVGEAGAQAGQVAVHEVAQALRRPGPLLPEPQPPPPRGQHAQLAHAVRRRAPGHRVGAAGVVADHAAERAAAVGGGVGAEAQAVRGGGVLETVEDQARLDDGRTRLGIESDQPVHVPGEVQHHAGARRLPGDRRPAAPRHHRYAELPAHLQYRGHVVGVPRRHDTERDPPVVRGVHGGQRPGGGVEPDLAADGPAQCCLQIGHALQHGLSWFRTGPHGRRSRLIGRTWLRPVWPTGYPPARG
ncbi:hypothetical protein RKD42_003901 [Streptomyces ambofaciens]